MFNKILKMHQSKKRYCTIILQTKRTLQSRWGGEGVEFCEFAGPPHHAKKIIFDTPILKIGNCKTSIYNIQEMHFRDPQCQKWHFSYPWYKKMHFETPLHKKWGPRTFSYVLTTLYKMAPNKWSKFATLLIQ